MKKIILMLFLITMMAIQANAFNDPGHDSLYILKIGNSTIIGSLNITQNLTTRQITAQERVFSPYLIIKGDGDPAGAAINRIVGTDAGLEISSLNELRLNAGVGGIVKIGTSGVPTGLNVTGSIWSENTLVCLANGTNCPNLGEGFEGTLQIIQGGTGATTAEEARTNLEVAGIGNCPAGHVVVNTTSSGVQCIQVGTGDGSVTSITTGTGLTGGIITESGEIAFNTTWGDNRYYVQSSADSLFILKSGDTMTNFLTLHADPSSNLHAATKQYVDLAISGNMSGVEGSKWTQTGSDIYYDGGKVGIGTNTPQQILHVRDNIGTPYVRIEGSTTTADPDNFAAFELRDSGETSRWQFRNTKDKSFTFSHNDGASWSSPFKITSTGNIETIGTLFVRELQTSSGNSFYIKDATNADGFRLNVDGVAIHKELAVGTSDPTTAPSQGLYVVGRVGIGITNPSEKLTVSGNMSVTDNAMMKLVMFSENNDLGMYANSTDIIIGNISAFI